MIAINIVFILILLVFVILLVLVIHTGNKALKSKEEHKIYYPYEKPIVWVTMGIAFLIAFLVFN